MNVLEQARKLVAQIADMSRDAIRNLLKTQSKEVNDAVSRLRMESFFTDGNENKESREESLSPSGKYKLVTSCYATSPGSWSYSRGIVYSRDNDKPIADVKRNYRSFPFSWIENHANGHDYLVCGSDYQGQTIIELDTGLRVDFLPTSAEAGHGFCWAAHHPNVNGTLLAVEGCYWACPYETVIYDFSEPMNPPWPELHRGDPNFAGWNGIDSCGIGFSHAVVKVVDGMSDEVKAFAGKTIDDLTAEQMTMVEAEESRLGCDAWEDKVISKEWKRPSALESTKTFIMDRLSWWKEQVNDPKKYPRGVKPENVVDHLLVMDKMIGLLSEKDRSSLHADPVYGPLLAWKTEWTKGVE